MKDRCLQAKKLAEIRKQIVYALRSSIWERAEKNWEVLAGSGSEGSWLGL